MWILIAVLLILTAFWLIGWWLSRGEDLSRFDGPPKPEVGESFGSPSGPSAEHRQAEDDIRAVGTQVKGMSRGQMLRFMRAFMEDLPSGHEFAAEFRGVDVNGVPGEWVLAPGSDPQRRMLYLHGGAFIAGSPNSHRTLTSSFAEQLGAAVLAIDYRLMPENARRKGIDDCFAAYHWILQNGPNGPGATRRLYVSGDSAGGNLSLVVSAWSRDQGLRLPDAVIALSPLTDSSYVSPSMRGNVESDTMLGPLFGRLMRIPRPLLAWLYLLETRFRPTDPLVSPLRGDLAGLPPTLIQVSAAEMLLDDARRYVNKAHAAGSPARLQTWSGLLHVWQILNPQVPEALEAIGQVRAFVESVEADRN